MLSQIVWGRIGFASIVEFRHQLVHMCISLFMQNHSKAWITSFN